MSIERILIGDSALDHVRSRLTQGLSLTKAVLNGLDLNELTWSVFAPPGTGRKRLTGLDYGGVGDATASLEKVAAAVSGHLTGGNERWLIVENRLARRHDPVLAGQPGEKMFIEDEVYHVVRPGESRSAIRDAIRNGESAQGVVFFVTASPRGSVAPDRLGPSEIEAVASKTELIGVDAFDGESYVLGVRA